ncbi:MAG: ferritin-like protein [Chloroflexi bacterium]|nr:ferritin-like protein [Chloroflexota bacterium]
MMDAPVRIENRAQLIYLLTEAAELEHGIMCCYLFAAFSMKRSVEEGISEEQLRLVRRWRRTILQISIEEMLHMCLACNLLTAVGGAPHLRRPNLPVSPKAYPPSFKLELAPFCQQTLENFIFIERPEDPEPGAGAGTSFGSPVPQTPKLSDIFSSAREYQNQGRLYHGIEDGLQYLSQKYGEDRLFLGPPKAQIAGAYFNLPGLDPVTDLTSAEAALQGIIVQGEGGRGFSKDSHHGRFLAIQEEYEQVLREDPTFVPARPVMWNPYSMLPNDVGDDLEVNLIEDPLSIDISNLFDGCYEILIQVLGRLFAHGEESEDELTQLAEITEGLMVDVIGPLGDALTRLPAGPSHSGLTAGPSFRFSRDINTPPHRDAARALFIERLKELSAYCGFLQTEGSLSSVLTRVRASLGRYAEQLDK